MRVVGPGFVAAPGSLIGARIRHRLTGDRGSRHRRRTRPPVGQVREDAGIGALARTPRARAGSRPPGTARCPSAHDASGSVSAGFRNSFAASSNLRMTISPRPRSSASRGSSGFALDRARQDLERVADAPERHLRPRQRQHRIDVGRIATVSRARRGQRRLPLAAVPSFDSGGAKSGFSSSDIVSGCCSEHRRRLRVQTTHP